MTTAGEEGRSQTGGAGSSTQRLAALSQPEMAPSEVKAAVDSAAWPWDDFTPEYIEKYNKYQTDYVRRIKAKYFSRKAYNGANIFDEEITIENEVIKTSRCPCTKSFINPVLNLEEHLNLPSSSAETYIPNRKNLRKSN